MIKELIKILQELIPKLSKEDSQLIIDEFCIVKPSEIPEIEIRFNYFTFDKTNNTGSSIKSGNVLLNMRKLLIDSSEIGLTIAGVAATPYLIPLAALVIWNKVWSNIKIDLDENHAMTIKLMWENCDIERNWIDEQKAFKLLNQYFTSKNRNQMIFDDFKKILSNLEKMKCIEKSGDTNWWLREWVKKDF